MSSDGRSRKTVVRKILKGVVGLALLPLCWAASRTLFFLLRFVPLEYSSLWASWALPIGFLIAVLGFFLLPRSLRTYVLAHELTHAVWGLLMGAKIGKMRISKEGGYVELSKNNFLISLAPYFFPFYTIVVIAGWYGCGFFFDLTRYEPWWMAMIGLTWGFHGVFTLYMLSQKQSDVEENGCFFSYVIIYLANLFFIMLWMVMIGVPTCSDVWKFLIPESTMSYKFVWMLLLRGWDQFRTLSSQLA